MSPAAPVLPPNFAVAPHGYGAIMITYASQTRRTSGHTSVAPGGACASLSVALCKGRRLWSHRQDRDENLGFPRGFVVLWA
jgi:hypothetical protein